MWSHSEPSDTLSKLKPAIDALVYLSVLLGILLLYFAAPLVPSWLLVSLTAGEAAYAVCAAAVAMGRIRVYYAVLILAVLVLAASLPQPEHYALASSGQAGPFAIFAAGSAVQVCLLVLIPIYLVRRRRTGDSVDVNPSPSHL